MTIADKVYAYYVRHPSLSVTRTQLCTAMQKDGIKACKNGIVGGVRILVDDGHLLVDGRYIYNRGENLKLNPDKPPYVSKKQERYNRKSQTAASKRRYDRIALKEKTKAAEAELKYLMLCVSWNALNAAEKALTND